MPLLNIYTIPVLIAALLNAVLILFVLLKTRLARVHLIFVFWNLALCLWNIGVAGIFGATSLSTALAWSHFTCYGVVFIPPTFLHLVLALCEDRSVFRRRLLYGLYGVSVLLLVLDQFIPNFLTRGVALRFWGYCFVGGPGSDILDPLLAFSSIYSLVLLRRMSRQMTDVRRNQLQYVFWGTAAVFIGGAFNVLALHGANIYPIGNIINIFYSLLMGYAIVSYEWLDIRLAVREGVVYGSLAVGLTATYVGIVYLVEQTLAANHLGAQWGVRLLAFPPTVLAAPSLKRRIEPWIGNFLFSDWPEVQQRLRELSLKVCGLLDERQIAEQTVQGLAGALEAVGVAFYAFRPEKAHFQLLASTGRIGTVETIAEKDLNPERLSELGESPWLTRQLDWRLHTDPHAPPELIPLRDWLARQRAAVLLSVVFQRQLLGCVLLGAHRSGNMYSQEHMKMVQDMTHQIALALNNAHAVRQLEDQRKTLQKAREMSVMGTLATEMAHELTKPLTRIINAGVLLKNSMSASSKESLTKIENEAHRAAEILDSFAMLSPHVPLQRLPASLADLLEEAVAVLGIRGDKSIRIIEQYDWKTAAFVNPGQIVQVLVNILQNAWEAMPEGGTLTLGLRAVDGAPEKKRAEVTITDTGPGIPLEIKDRIFDPFVTTKKTRRGRGVGLAISRAMIERHGGDIQIQSPAAGNTGTRVVIRLPQLPMEDIYEK